MSANKCQPGLGVEGRSVGLVEGLGMRRNFWDQPACAVLHARGDRFRAHRPEPLCRQILWKNAARLYHPDPSPIPGA
jgi:hypothetical protein